MVSYVKCQIVSLTMMTNVSVIIKSNTIIQISYDPKNRQSCLFGNKLCAKLNYDLKKIR